MGHLARGDRGGARVATRLARHDGDPVPRPIDRASWRAMVRAVCRQAEFRHRADTGAETTSIDASDIVEFERDGKKWVQFTVTDRSTDVISEIKAPVVRNVRIKQHGVDNVRRQVVELELRMGSLRERVEVTLADREKFDYPILIGRNFLRGRAVVDVSRKYLTLDKSNDSETNPIPSEPETPEPVAASQ